MRHRLRGYCGLSLRYGYWFWRRFFDWYFDLSDLINYIGLFLFLNYSRFDGCRRHLSGCLGRRSVLGWGLSHEGIDAALVSLFDLNNLAIFEGLFVLLFATLAKSLEFLLNDVFVIRHLLLRLLDDEVATVLSNAEQVLLALLETEGRRNLIV